MELSSLARRAALSAAVACVVLTCTGCNDSSDDNEDYYDPCCGCHCPNATNASCTNECQAKCCDTNPSLDECSCSDGRPYIIQGKSLLATVKTMSSNASTIMQSRRADGWNHIGSNLGHMQMQQTVVGKTSLSAQLLAEALESAGSRSNPLPEVAGTIALEPRLPELLAAARGYVASLPLPERTRWYSAGLAEHASIGSFAKLALELLVAGAPPRLLRQAIAAQEEELLHAHIALALANKDDSLDNNRSRLMFPEHSLDVKADPTTMRAAAVEEGLKGEGHSALRLYKQALEALNDIELGQPDRRSFGELVWAMAQDEARHAELASDTIEWLSAEASKAPPDVVVKSGTVQVTEL